MHISDWMERVDMGEEIQEVYLHRFLFKLSVGLVSIFLPLYILNLGYSKTTVFLFFLTYYLTYVLASFPNGMIASKLGFKHTSLLSSPIILTFYILLRQSPAGLGLYLIAFLGGMGFNLYWAGMNPEIAESSDKDKREEETGYFFSMPSLASMLSPAIGGLILAVYNFKALFLFAAICITASFLPFIFSKEHHEGMEVKPLSFFHRDHINDFITYAGRGVDSVGKKVLWPLYLAVVIEQSTKIGGAGSLLALGSAVMSIGLGKITNDQNRDSVIISGVVVTGISYLIMSQVMTPIPALIVSFLNGLGRTAIGLPVYSRAMDKAEKEDYVEYFAFRETALSVGRVIALIILFGFFNYLPYGFTAGFILIATSLLFVGYFGRKV